MKIDMFELKPVDGRKSFYGKANILFTPAGVQLISYKTIVATWDGSKKVFIREWEGYSATTMRHVNAFMQFLGFRVGGKKWWDSLPVGEPVTISDTVNAV